MNRSEILIIRYRSTTVVSSSQDAVISAVDSTDPHDHQAVIEAQPNRKARLTSRQMKKLAGWTSRQINRLFSR
jgi:hypothetical protein